MHFYILLFFTLVVGFYSHSTDAFEKSPSRQRRQFWSGDVNEVSDNVNGASSCISAVDAFLKENPEVPVVAKRSIAEHILSKRGVKTFFKKWIDKLNPIKYFYNCFMFLKYKGVEIYHAIEHAEEVTPEFYEETKKTAQELSELYKYSLYDMIQSLDKVKSYLEHSESNGTSGQKVLYKTIDGMLSSLNSYTRMLRIEGAKDIFLNTMKVFPQVGNSLSKLDWNPLSSLNLSSSPNKVRTFVKKMQHFDLAHNMMSIMKQASEFYPDEFVAENYPHAKDLACVSCFSFLLNTTEFHKMPNALSYGGKIQYLEQARKCGIFVTEHTTDDQTAEKKSIVLIERFIQSMNHSVQFLDRLEYYLHEAEKAVEHWTGTKKLLREAVRNIQQYLIKEIWRATELKEVKEFLRNAFYDIPKALDKVKAIISEWFLFTNDYEKEETVFPTSYEFGLLDHYSVIPNVETLKSFLGVMAHATSDFISVFGSSRGSSTGDLSKVSVN